MNTIPYYKNIKKNNKHKKNNIKHPVTTNINNTPKKEMTYPLTGEKELFKPTTILSPVPPVLVSCGDSSISNIITIAWTGTINTIPPMTYISLRKSRHSYDIIKKNMEFVINLAPENLVFAVDFCGIYSGKKYNKWEVNKLTPTTSNKVSAPQIKECPINIECVVKQIIPLGSHEMFISEIVSVSVDKALLDETNKLNIDRAKLLAFAHGEYISLGKTLNKFAFSSKKENTPPKNKNK